MYGILISVMNSQKIHNGAHAWGSSATDRWGAPSGNGKSSIQGCGGNFLEEEVFTPQRGGRPAPEPQGAPREVRAVPQIVPEDSLRDDGQGQRNFRSPVEMLTRCHTCRKTWPYSGKKIAY